MDHADSKIRLAGERVTVSYVADPQIGHGQFTFENHGAVAETATIEKAWLRTGNNVTQLSGVTVFDIERERSLDPAKIELPPGASVRFYVGFPAVAWEPRFGETCEVGIRTWVGEVRFEAASEVVMERRIPR
jgi:hypothetical protein